MTSLLFRGALAPNKVDLSTILPQPEITTEQFYAFCKANPELRMEKTAAGEVIVMPPAFSDTGSRNFEIAVELGIWARQDGTGRGFDSSAGSTLPIGYTLPMGRIW